MAHLAWFEKESGRLVSILQKTRERGPSKRYIYHNEEIDALEIEAGALQMVICIPKRMVQCAMVQLP